MKRRGCGLEQAEQARSAPTLRDQAYHVILAERRRVAVQHLAALGGQVHANCTLCQEGIRERVRGEQQATAERRLAGPAQDPEKQHQFKHQNVIFIGNDENDIGCLQAAGCGVVPADAHASTLPHADLILTRNGGHGAVRELADLITDKIHSHD